MSIAIIIVGYRNPTDIERCLARLATSTRTDFTVVIVENGGRDAFGDLGRRLDATAEPSGAWSTTLSSGQEVRGICPGSNLGYAGAINAAIDALTDEPWRYLWILNPDTEPASTALEVLVDKAERSGCGIVGSRIELADTGTVQMYGVRWRAWLGRGLSIGLGADADAHVDERAVEAQIDFVSGASMLVSRAYVDAVGPLAADYFLYYEDADWCVRRGEHRLGYAHDSVVRHQSGTTIGSHADPREQSPLSAYLMERNRILFSRRFHPLHTPVVVVIALAFLARQAVRGAPSTALVGLRGWGAGVLGRRGAPPASVFATIGPARDPADRNGSGDAHERTDARG